MKQLAEILLNWPKPYIFGVDLSYLLNKSPNARYASIKRALKKEILLSLRRDMYLISKQQSLVDAFEISSLLYGPSYVSFESALSYHGWIPEGVKTTTCACLKRSKTVETPLGLFSYEHIPALSFALGREAHTSGSTMLFIANPWKAIADMIYARARTWTTFDHFIEDLRIESEYLMKSDTDLLKDLIANYPSKRVRQTLQVLQKGLYT